MDTQLALKANQSTTYTKAEVGTNLALKANQTTTYTKTEVDSIVSPTSDKTYVDTQLALNANQPTTYTKTDVDSLVSPKSDTTYVDTQVVLKADQSTTDTIEQVDTARALKANQSTTYIETEVQQLFLNLIDNAPASLDTLNELANALANDANYAATIQNQLDLKANQSDVYNKLAIDNLLNGKHNAITTSTSQRLASMTAS